MVLTILSRNRMRLAGTIVRRCHKLTRRREPCSGLLLFTRYGDSVRVGTPEERHGVSTLAERIRLKVRLIHALDDAVFHLGDGLIGACPGAVTVHDRPRLRGDLQRGAAALDEVEALLAQ